MYYLTKRSLSVEQNDESQVASSSSPLPNQKLDEVAELDDVDGLEAELLRRSLETERVDLRRKPSMAFPMTCGSTNGPRESHRNLLRGFRVSLGRSSLSLNRSRTSLENDTVALAVLRSDFFRAIGWWRFSNHPESAAAFLSAADVPLATICFALCRIDTSKLFERFEREIPAPPSGAASVLLVDGEGGGFALTGVVSPILFISVADDASEVIIDIKSELVTTIPVFLKNPGDLDPLAAARPAVGVADDDDGAITGFSDARRLAGIGVNVDATKSEYLRFV